MEIRKNDEFELTIEDMSEDGAGIGKQDGYIWFVKDAVIGDRIRARAMKMKKNYGFARLMEVLEASKDRVMPECPVMRRSFILRSARSTITCAGSAGWRICGCRSRQMK